MDITKTTTINGITVNHYSVNGREFSLPIDGADYVVACGGDEMPLQWQGKIFCYMYDRRQRHHDWYSIDDDLRMDIAPVSYTHLTLPTNREV